MNSLQVAFAQVNESTRRGDPAVLNEGVPASMLAGSSGAGIVLGRTHARRLRDVYRSAGWPCLDAVEVELLAAGLLARTSRVNGHDAVRLTDAGIHYLGQAFQKNRHALTAHNALVARIAQAMQRDGRVVWTGLSVRARLPPSAGDDATDTSAAPFAGAGPVAPAARWKICRPDVFSIRNTTVAGYLEPIVHEIKVSRADLLGDLKFKDKRDSYLDVGGQCWYVLGCDSKGRPIGQADEVPEECGVMFAAPDGRLEVARYAPSRPMPDLPFLLWMALAKATPLAPPGCIPGEDPGQGLLVEQDAPPDP